MRLKLAVLASLAVLAAGCGSSGAAAPWLTVPNATSHQKNFPIAPGDTHGPAVGQAFADCNGCHYDKATAAPSASFKVFTCTRCHVLLRSGVWHDDPQSAFSAWHVAAGVSSFDSNVAATNVVGVDQFDAACRSCHLGGIAVDHAVRFVLPHQDAAGAVVAKCADCHLDQADRKVLGCASCHPHELAATTTGHALVPGFMATDSTLCARCHEDGKIPVKVTAHAAGANGFIVGAGVHSGPAGGACLACHAQDKTTPPRTFVADFKVTTCIGCHTVKVGGVAFHDDQDGSLTTLHATAPTFASTVTSLGLSAACRSCHTDGGAGAPANHELLFPRAAGTRHAGLSCVQCHGTGLRTDLTSLQCAACHNGIAGFVGKHDPIVGKAILNLYVGHLPSGTVPLTSPNCLKCHADSQVNRIASHTIGDSGYGRLDHYPAGCISCHATTRPASQKPYPAVDFTFPSPPTRTGTASCATSCHSAIPN